LAILYKLSKLNHPIIDINFVKELFEFDEINNLEKNEKYQDQDNFKEMRENSEKKENHQNNINIDNSDKSNDKIPKQQNEDILIDKHYRDAFKHAYNQMDILLARGKGETSKVRWSGATSCSCIIEKRGDDTWAHIANCGKIYFLKENRIRHCRRYL
jgi:hypothetical protein